MGHARDRSDRPVRESDPLLRADRRAVILTAKDRVPRREITRRARLFRYLRSIAHAAAPTLAFSRRAASTSKAVPFNAVRKAPSRGPKGTIVGLASFGSGLGSGERRACKGKPCCARAASPLWRIRGVVRACDVERAHSRRE